MLAGPPSKKRKLNEMSSEEAMVVAPNATSDLQRENQQLRQRLAEAEGHLALLSSGSSGLKTQMSQFNT